MENIDMRKFFSPAAGEANWKNDWTKEFLPHWNFFERMSDVLVESRENITIEKRTKEYYELEINTTTDDVNDKRGEERRAEVFSFKETPQPFELFGLYQSIGIRKVFCFEAFYNASEEIKHIVRIHERMHAFQQANYTYGIWNGFEAASPVYLEFLAQLFTYRCVKDSYLEKHFRDLSKRQPFIYTTWEEGVDLSDAEIFKIYQDIKDNDKSGFKKIDAIKNAYPVKSIFPPTTTAINPNNYFGKEWASIEVSEAILKDPYSISEIDFKTVEDTAHRRIFYDIVRDYIEHSL